MPVVLKRLPASVIAGAVKSVYGCAAVVLTALSAAVLISSNGTYLHGWTPR